MCYAGCVRSCCRSSSHGTRMSRVRPHSDKPSVSWPLMQASKISEEHAGALQERVAEAMERSPELPVVVDTEPEMMPSMAIGALVGIWQRRGEQPPRAVAQRRRVGHCLSWVCWTLSPDGGSPW